MIERGCRILERINEKLAKDFLVAVIGIVVIISISEFVMQQDYVQIHKSFEEPEYIEAIEVKDPIAVNGMMETENGYIIDGVDAYFVYSVNIDEASAIEVTFEDELADEGMVQIFYAAEGMPFSEDNSAFARFSQGTKSVRIPIQMKDVSTLRVDIEADEKIEVNIEGIRQDTWTAQVSDIFSFSGFYLFGGIYLIVLIGYVLNLKYDFMKNQKIRYWTLVVVAWVGIIIVAFMPVLCGEYDLSYSNIMYTTPPWKCLGVNVSGPTLSDPIDVLLPQIYQVYYGEGYYNWNSYVAFGTANIGIVAYLNPFNWFYFLPIRWAVLLKAMFEISVAYFGMCYLLKTMKLEIVSTIVGAVSYAASSIMVMWLFWPHTDVMMLAPIVLSLGIQLVSDKKLCTMFLMAFVTFLMLIAEMPTYAAHIMYLLGFYVLIMTIIQYRKRYKEIIYVYGMFACAMIMAIVAAFPYLYTLLNSVVKNGYADNRQDEALSIYPLNYLRTVILPYYHEGLGAHISESTLYVGIVALILLLWSAFGLNRKKVKYWYAAFVVTFLLPYTHLLDVIYMYMPANKAIGKRRVIAIVALLACIVAAINLNDILKNKALYKVNLKRWVVHVIAVCFAAFVYAAYGKETSWAIWSAIGIVFIVIGTEVMIAVEKETIVKISQGMIVAISVINMGVFAQHYLPMIEKGADIIPTSTDSIQYLQENIGDARICAIGEEGWNFFPNTNMFYNIRNIASHSGTNTNSDVRTYLLELDDQMKKTETAFHNNKIDNYNLLKYGGVKYILKSAAEDVKVSDDAILVFCGNDGEEIYELDSYAERLFLSEGISVLQSQEEILEAMKKNYIENQVWICGKQNEEAWKSSSLEKNEGVTILDDSIEYIKTEVVSNEERILVLNEYNDDNWKAYIDGEETEIICVNYLFKGVKIDEGIHVVEFVYDDEAEMIMLIVAMAVICIMLLGIITTYARTKSICITEEEGMFR